MDTNTYNIENIRDYLLGAASPEDTEGMDELSIADTEFADTLSAAENDLIDSYIHGELDDATTLRFESHFLATPRRREKVQIARSLQEYAKANWAGAVKPVEKAAPDKIGFFAMLRGFAELRPAFRFAMSAAALLVVGLLGWAVVRDLVGGGSPVEIAANTNLNNSIPADRPTPDRQTVEPQNTEPTPERDVIEPQGTPTAVPNATPKQSSTPSSTPKPPPPRQPVIASFILSPPLRGSASPSLKVPARTEEVAIRLELETNGFKSYRVAVRKTASGPVVWQSGRLRGSSQGGSSVRVIVPAKLLAPAVYIATVTADGEGGPEIIGDYVFRVVQ